MFWKTSCVVTIEEDSMVVTLYTEDDLCISTTRYDFVDLEVRDTRPQPKKKWWRKK